MGAEIPKSVSYFGMEISRDIKPEKNEVSVLNSIFTKYDANKNRVLDDEEWAKLVEDANRQNKKYKEVSSKRSTRLTRKYKKQLKQLEKEFEKLEKKEQEFYPQMISVNYAIFGHHTKEYRYKSWKKAKRLPAVKRYMIFQVLV